MGGACGQLIDETFRENKPAVFQYLRVDNGKTVIVETLERIENGMAQPEQLPQEVEPEVLTEVTGSAPKMTNLRTFVTGYVTKNRILFGTL